MDKVFDTLVDSKIKTVACRHEQNAAFIAAGIGRMTGKAGVCIGTSGAWMLEPCDGPGDRNL
nr:thiamine pyrophosphate-binding protein [Edaphobacter aggregans]